MKQTIHVRLNRRQADALDEYRFLIGLRDSKRITRRKALRLLVDEMDTPQRTNTLPGMV